MDAKQYWQEYLASQVESQASDAIYAVDQFGDSPDLAEELAQLVRSQIKTATCSALWEWETAGEALPEPGSKMVVLDGKGQPCCIIEITEVSIRAFNQVDAQFAYDEGEGDRSLASWRREHWKYFSRVLPQIGKAPSQTMLLVCERFQVIYQKDSIETID
ncbi:MAG TPA: ASCH domain-containing protein [Leptolyngbyaceae cyanobacterium M33_DOE_097]|uniref:ASCH domain-containing protein n=1 Tax=Oscillatoriales cyanobacterium SpSt-418 TaxID=2282169 RepID=A0A7C3PK03_9CYAN|nr:ASCH domain-containing protein [Leptolyngbyaceae cyanobacterium M33_DOE_097]